MFIGKERGTGCSFHRRMVLFALALAFLVWQGQALTAFAQGTAKVVAESGKIREQANTKSTVVASVKKNDSLDVTASTTDSNGYTWYKVYVDNSKQGYIRGDLVTVEGTIPGESQGSSNTTASNTEVASAAESGGNRTTVGSNNSVSTSADEGAAEQSSTESTTDSAVTASQVATARVTTTVRVRTGASTDFDVAASAEQGTEVTVSGEAIDGEEKKWYQISYNDGDKTINGFIREDFLEVVEMVVQEPEVQEPIPETEPEVVNEDYRLEYRANDTGEMDWYLLDNIQGNSWSLTQLLSAATQMQEIEETEAKQLSTMKIIIVVMAVVLVLLVVAVTILLFKLHDSYEEYDDEDEEDEAEDEDEDEEDEDDEDDEEEDDEEEIEVRTSKSRFRRGAKDSSSGRFGKSSRKEERAPKSGKTEAAEEADSKETKSWQSKDFLELDDDMEFEFLDL